MEQSFCFCFSRPTAQERAAKKSKKMGGIKRDASELIGSGVERLPEHLMNTNATFEETSFMKSTSGIGGSRIMMDSRQVYSCKDKTRYRGTNILMKPSLWRCQNENRDSFKELLIQSFLNPLNSNPNTLQREKERDGLARQGTLVSQNGSDVVSAQQSMVHHKQASIQYVECISKSYRFLCSKCGKKFKKLITSELQNQAAIDNLEDTLNQPQNGECQCPFCYNPLTNLLDVTTQLVVGPWYANDGDIKEEDQEDDENDAMKVTVEEDFTSTIPTQIKNSQVTQKQFPIMLPATNSVAQRRLLNHETGNQFDVSLYNHMSQRDFSPQPHLSQNIANISAEIFDSRLTSGGNGLNHSLSPTRIYTNSSLRQNFNSEFGGDSKKLSLHTYHIRNKNGSPTAQVAILKDSDDITPQQQEENVGETASQTTKLSGVPNMATIVAKSVPQPQKLRSQQPSPIIPRQPDEDQCKSFNADIMRNLVSRKMAKQKTFYEMKVLPQHPVIIPPQPNQIAQMYSPQQRHMSAAVLQGANGQNIGALRNQQRISPNLLQQQVDPELTILIYRALNKVGNICRDWSPYLNQISRFCIFQSQGCPQQRISVSPPNVRRVSQDGHRMNQRMLSNAYQ